MKSNLVVRRQTSSLIGKVSSALLTTSTLEPIAPLPLGDACTTGLDKWTSKPPRLMPKRALYKGRRHEIQPRIGAAVRFARSMIATRHADLSSVRSRQALLSISAEPYNRSRRRLLSVLVFCGGTWQYPILLGVKSMRAALCQCSLAALYTQPFSLPWLSFM